jgi:RHS repeat-associated protein
MHLHTGEGRLRRAGQSVRFDYILKDHLGNTRTMFTITDNNDIQPLQSNHYYPFGMRFNQSASYASTENRYLYNGKELQEDLGLNWYDYGARFYDPAIGRFSTVDPMAESYYGLSGYNYVGNNPIRRIDPDGRMMSEIFDLGGNGMYDPDWLRVGMYGPYEWMDNVNSQANTPEGYEYIGASDEDVVEDVGLPADASTIKYGKRSGSLQGDNGGGIAVVKTATNMEGTIDVDAEVSLKKDNVTSNNKMGKTFEGISVNASFSQESKSGDSNLNMKYKGMVKTNRVVF